MTNPLTLVDKTPKEKLGREGLQRLCDKYNDVRAAAGVAERYRINKDGPVWKLETFTPYTAPSSRRLSQRITQREVDRMPDDLLRLGLKCGAIVEVNGTFRPSGEPQ